ncbi:hypothetical protein LOTGIDRAFT_186762 [Lottia gigantea]|uniref:Phosphatidylinositol-specific phospholipase C X domain-containing protein n=1 Tax=Lottia gigantea TaxID=225164 RepID=V4B030_LOTGI|nr:hypothetical protein LOTGIDRAFT_186762 [Lottia gigantea]ESO99366.1 hypothetical protein LOTGIDRAFT_186762 [Lottia gigantea]
MGEIPVNLHETPLNQLAIPGSHDSASFEFDKNGGVGPDAAQIVKQLEKLFGPFIKDVLYRWAKTQNMNFTQQLTAGIRYFDFRVSTRQGYQDLYFLHSLYADKVEKGLHDIDIFLDSHPKEIVILDFNHLYAMGAFQHKQLISMILEIFGYKVCPLVDMNSLNLNMMWENKLQVIVIYHDPVALENHMIWPGSCIRAPWANTVDVQYLLQYLDNVYTSGHSNNIFLSYQGILTASTKFVIEHILGSLEKELSDKATPAIVQWLADKQIGPNNLNICITDVTDQYDFISTIISKNK